MAENEYNDEYQFADLDAIGTEENEEHVADTEIKQQQPRQGNNIVRNAVIALILVALAMLGYKFFSAYFARRTTTEGTIVPPISSTAEQTQVQTPPPVATPPAQPEQPAAPQQAAPVVTQQPTVDNSQVTQKLFDLEAAQQNVNSEVNAVSAQLSGINSNVNDLSEKMNNLNGMIAELATKLEQQSNQIASLTERARPKPPVRRRVVASTPSLTYYIQAVIPGRAWLIATNGSTLTVREGTSIAGYGVVRLIDANQGRVITSSGRIIRFSQQDS